MDAAADDPQELAVEVRLNRQALVRGEDADAVNLASLYHDRPFVRVHVGLIADVAIARGVLVLRVPQGAAAAEVVGEQDLDVAIEVHVGRPAPSPTELAARPETGLGVQCTTVLGAGAAVRHTLGGR